jgi:hypothetical protein
VTNRIGKQAVRVEATRIFGMPRQQARQVVSDRIARAYLLDGDEQLVALEFNAHLATELRELAEAVNEPNIWSAG